jgi:hypothetical protein
MAARRSSWVTRSRSASGTASVLRLAARGALTRPGVELM